MSTTRPYLAMQFSARAIGVSRGRSFPDELSRSLASLPPRGVQHSHHGFVEFGAFSRVSRGSLSFYPWNALPTIPETPAKKTASTRDPLRLARYYQSLLDTGEFKTRADLARFLGVSRANVTQVLKWLEVLIIDLPIPDSA